MLVDAYLLLIFPVCSSEPLISSYNKNESDILISKQTHVYSYSCTFFLFTKLDPV